MNTFTRAASALLVAFSLAGCLGSGADPLASQKASIHFCNSYNSTAVTMAAYIDAGLLSESEVALVRNMRNIAGPNCAGTLPPEPTSAMLSVLDAVIAIQIAKESKDGN